MAVQGLIRATSCLALCVVFAGCSGATPKEPMGDTPRRAEPMASKSSAVGISEKRLEEIHFKNLWTNPLGTRIEQAWFLLDNLYVTTVDENGHYRLLRVNGETGLVDWVFDLEGKLEFRPDVYRYPKELRASHPEEVFIVQNDEIYDIDNRNGAQNNRPFKCDFPVSTPVTAAQDYLIIGSWNKRVYGLKKNTGDQAWTYITEDPITAAPEIGGVNAYVGSEDGFVYQFNIGAGYEPTKNWKPHATGGKIVAQPLYFAGRIFVGSWDYKVYCLEEYQGFQRWSYIAGAPVTKRIFPFRDWVFAISEQELAQGPEKWKVSCLRAADGKEVWHQDGYQEVAAVDALQCYAVGAKGKLVALRLEDGKTQWTLDDAAKFDFILSQDADKGRSRNLLGRIYLVSKSGYLQAIEPRR